MREIRVSEIYRQLCECLNYYYHVKAVDGVGHKPADSNEVGEFDKNLINEPPSRQE